MRWYWKLVIVVIVLALGGAIYDTVNNRRSVGRLNRTVESFRERNAELIGRLTDAQNRVAEVKGELAEIERASEKLGVVLKRSQAELAGLRTENRHLTKLLERGADNAAGIRAESEIIAGSLDNALDIVGRLQEDYTEK